MPYWCPSYWLPVVCNMKYTTWLPVVCKPGTSTAHPSRNSNSSSTNTFLRIYMYIHTYNMYNIYMYMMKYIHILYVDTSLISKNARIDHHFQRKREFGKKINFSKNRKFWKPCFFALRVPWGPLRAPEGPRGPQGTQHRTYWPGSRVPPGARE